MDRHSTVANLSCMPSQLTKMAARVAGVHLRQVSGSAGNVCSFQLRDGLTYATVGQLYDSKGQANGYHKLPYVRATSGLYAQATGSATGTSWACYYVEDEESGTVSDTPSLMFEGTSLVPTIGSATVAATRSTTVTALDNVPILRTAAINEIASPGARRIHNPLSKCTDDSGLVGGGTTPPTVTTSTTHISKTCCAVTFTSAMTSTGFGGCRAVGTSFTTTASTAYAWRGKFSLSRALVGSETLVAFFNTASETRTFTFNASNSAQFVGNWVGVSEYSTTSSTSRYFLVYLGTVVATDVTLYSTERAFYNTIGNANTQIPHEFIDGATDYGAGVVGVKYSDRANGVSVTSNILTDATGAALTGVKGVLVEPAVTESVSSTYYRQLSAWSVISGVPVIASDNISGADGLTLADKLTGDGAATTGVFVPTMTLTASSTYCLQSVQKAGTSTLSRLAVWDVTGAVYKTNVDIAWTGGVPSTSAKNANATETYTHIGNGWYLISVVFPTGANTGYQIYIQPDRNATSKYIYVDWTSLALESYPTSIRPGANRTATTYSFPTPSFITSGAAWSGYVEFFPEFGSSTTLTVNTSIWGPWTDGNNRLVIYKSSGAATLGLKLVVASSTIFDVTGSVSFTANARCKAVVTYSPTTGYAMYFNGALIASSANTTVANFTPMNGAGVNAGLTYHTQKLYAATLSSARAILETT